jgi:hypothetical protein
MSSVVLRPSSQVSPSRSERSKREHSPSTNERATTPRVRPAQPAQPAGQRHSTPNSSLPPQRGPALSPNASGSSAASSASAGSAAAEGKGNGGGVAAPADKKRKSSSTDKDKEKDKEKDKWVESVDYAYEYIPVTQKREGRKNM